MRLAAPWARCPLLLKDKTMKTYINAGWTFTQAACFALRKQGVNLTEFDTRKGFLISTDSLVKSGVKYVSGTPETKGVLTMR
jgi:hypothetical protein